MIYDKDIREPLFEYLEEIYGKIRILEEKTVGRARADLVMVTEMDLYGIEIKSDADSYTRLAGQVKEYDQHFDYNIVVVGSSHAFHIEEHVPGHWGIITVEEMDSIDFYELRRPRPNPHMKWEKKLSILWKPELAMIQEWNDMPKYKEKSRAFVAKKIVERLPERIAEAILKKQMSTVLFERDYSRVVETLKEYRKGEIQKKIEKEEVAQDQLKLFMDYAAKGKITSRKGFAKKRRRRL